MYVVYLKTSPKREVVWCNPSFHSFRAERRHALAPNIEQYSFPLLESEYGSHVGFACLRVFCHVWVVPQGTPCAGSTVCVRLAHGGTNRAVSYACPPVDKGVFHYFGSSQQGENDNAPFSGAPPRTRVSRPTSRCRVQTTHTHKHAHMAGPEPKP
jgi:hypothetical protein